MRRRIVTSTVAVMALALLLFGVPLGWALGHVYRDQQLTRLQQAATIAAGSVPAEGLHSADPIEPPSSPGGISLGYYDGSGSLSAGRGPARGDAVLAGALGGHPQQGQVGSRLVTAVPIIVNETTVGAVEAFSPAVAVTWRTERTWLAMLALAVAALAVATVIAIWQSRRLAAPVADIVSAADRLGQGDFALEARRSGIAELDRAAATLEATSAQLGELMERERAFTANASHQLRTPLTALRLNLENALETPGVDGRAAVANAVTEVDRLQDTLDQLLALARTGALPGRRAPVADILAALERRWHPLLAERGRRLHVTAGQVPTGRTAPATLGQVLDILVDNATTHGRGTVEVIAAAPAGGVSVEVVDEGEGVSRARAPSATAGHGLGLALARSLVEATGGRLVFRSGEPAVAVIFP